MITLNNINLSSIDLSGIDLRGIKLGLGGRGGGSGDGFPQLPGDVTRWHFGGLTNEMMAAMDDPRIEDADHKGRFLSFKNFAWSGMSGVGGYVQDFNYFRNNATVDKVRIDEQNSNSIKVTILTTGINNAIYIPKNIYQFNKSYFIKISSEGYNEGDLSLSFYAPSTSTATTVKVPLNPNGITEIPAIKEDDFFAVYLDVGGKVGSITIEQLPLYPGFILGDGVDDFAVTEKELNFEDTYTVYTAFIPFQNNPTRNMILCGADSKKTFSMQYSSLVYVSFIAGNNYYINADFVNGLNLFACKRNGNNIYIKNLLTNKVVTGTCGDWVENAGLYYLWKNATYATYASFARAAIAGQTICNGYFSTDEDDEKVLDWYKKQYPWLFPDQAWTVTGKTNEDKDRATIANITGNGNNLVLSNFGFAEGSGYGLYNIQKFTNWNHVADRGDIVKNGYSVTITNSKITGSSTNYNTDILYSYNSSSTTIIFKVTGLVDGQKIFLGRKSVTDAYVIDKDGIYRSDYNIPQEGGKVIVGIGTVGFTGECNITIEQIPEYEGYLVTDGVDDKIVSSSFGMGKDFTVVGEWTLLQNINVSSLRKQSSFIIRNNDLGLSLFINRISHATLIHTKSLRAFCSNGVLYKSDWTEQIDTTPQDITSSNSELLIASHYDNKSEYDKIAFKNLAIYPTVLSKDDCIKAYNYLQTLKAK
jgi:hypothetical protein